MLVAAKPEGAEPVLHSDMGWQYQHATYCRHAPGERLPPRACRARANCIDNGATEQVFGHIKDEFFRGRDWDTFEGFKREPRGLQYATGTTSGVRRKLEGLTPAEIPEPGPSGGCLAAMI